MGERALTEVQYAIEATAGVTIAATKKLLKVVEPLKPDRVPSFPEEDFAARAKSLRSWIGQHLVSDTLTFNEAYFEMLPFIFSCGILGLAAPTATGTAGTAGSMYTWPYTPSMVAVNAPKSFSLEKADEIVGEHCGYGMFERINIKGTINQGAEISPVVITCDFFAKEWSSDAAADIAPPTVFPINAKLVTLDIDTLWASLGGTPMTNTLRAFEYDILTGLHPKQLGTANKYFAIHGEGIIDVTAAFTFEGNALANTEFGHWRTQTDRATRLTLTNPATLVSHGGNSVLRIDLFGRWREVIPFGEEDRGNNLHTMVMQCTLDPIDYLVTPDMLAIQVISSNNTP